MGDRDIGSKADLVGELANLSKSPSSSRGGVGVRGGRRMVGFSEAMAAFESYYERLCVIVERESDIQPLAGTEWNGVLNEYVEAIRR